MKLLVTSILAISFLFVCSTVSAEQGQEGKSGLQKQVQAVQAQLDQLVESGGKYAYMQLARKESLSPFAVAVQTNGDTLMLEIPKQDRNLNVADKVLKLREMLKLAADNNRIHAGALFVQAQVPHLGEQVDGVAIEMEHKKGLSVLRFSPYEISREREEIKFKKPVDKIKPLVFFKDVAQTQESVVAE